MYDHFVWNSPQNCFTRCVLILKESQSNCFWWVLRIVDAHGKWLDASICPKFCPEIKLEMCAWRIPVIGHFGGHLGIFETFIVHSLLRRGRILIKFNNVRGTHPYCRIGFFFFFAHSLRWTGLGNMDCVAERHFARARFELDFERITCIYVVTGPRMIVVTYRHVSSMTI